MLVFFIFFYLFYFYLFIYLYIYVYLHVVQIAVVPVTCCRWTWAQLKSSGVHWCRQWADHGHSYGGGPRCGVLPSKIGPAQQEGVSSV